MHVFEYICDHGAGKQKHSASYAIYHEFRDGNTIYHLNMDEAVHACPRHISSLTAGLMTEVAILEYSKKLTEEKKKTNDREPNLNFSALVIRPLRQR